jgi:glycerate kinase
VDLVAEEVRLDELVAGADLVVTGEGWLDATSFQGKVVGGVAAYDAAAGVPMLVVVGGADEDAAVRADVVSLVDRFGAERALAETMACITEVVAERLDDL